jgi:hypothetical protein
MTRAWKFLDERSRGIFSGFVWPTSVVNGDPGPWVESREVIACEQGVHACSVDQLAWWMSAQLWEIELAGPIVVSGPKMVAKRGRLIRLVDAWPELGPELAEWAVWRVRSHAVEVMTSVGSTDAGAELTAAKNFDDLGSTAARMDLDPTSAAGIAIAQVTDSMDDVSNPIFACWDAARAAGHRASAADRSINSYERAFTAERTLQSQWIADRLHLGS